MTLSSHLWIIGRRCRYMLSWLLFAATTFSITPLPAMDRPGSVGPAESRSTSQSSTEIRNVLLIVSDDLKASVLGCYGNEVCRTPNIDRLATQGIVFTRAYCQAMWCAPSRQSFMHSRYRGANGVNLGQHLRRQGLYTARVGKIYHMRVPGDIIAGTNGNDIANSWTERFNSTGLEAHTPGDYACLNRNIFTKELANRESTKMKHRAFVTVEYDGDGSDQPDYKSATKAIEIIQKHRDQSFFLAVGLVRPHYPMVAPRQYFQPYPWQTMNLPLTQEDDLEDIPRLGLAPSRDQNTGMGRYPDNQKRMWAGYYAATEFMDAQVGRILDELERNGLRESTAVLFISDHGYHLGEHTFWQKSNLHEEVTRVPFVISAPGFQRGRADGLVELTDLFPTICDLLERPIPDSVQGKSLVPVLNDRMYRVRDSAFYQHNGFGLRTDRWAYMRYKDDARELYDMSVDPYQFNNLARNPEFSKTMENLDEALNRRIRQAEGDR